MTRGVTQHNPMIYLIGLTVAVAASVFFIRKRLLARKAGDGAQTAMGKTRAKDRWRALAIHTRYAKLVECATKMTPQAGVSPDTIEALLSAGKTPGAQPAKVGRIERPPAELPKAGALRRRSSIAQQQLKAEIQPEAPFVVVPWSAFRGHGRIPRSSDQLAIELDDPESKHCIFLSHRWCRPWQTQKECEANGHKWAGEANPDDESGSKYRLIVATTEKLIDEHGWQDELDDVYLWMDFFGIDQDDVVRKVAGVRSLMGYCSLCELMLVPYPEKEGAAEDDTLLLPNAHWVPGGYGARAFCRLESFTFYVLSLLRQELASIYACSPISGVQRLDYLLQANLLPSAGDLYSESDREHIIAHEKRLLDELHAMALGGSSAAAAPALISAAGLGNDAAVKELLAGGVPVNARDDNGVFALLAAAGAGKTSAVAALLSADADVDMHAKNGATALFQAAWYGRVEAATLLLKAKCDKDKPWFTGCSPLSACTRNNQPEMVRLLLSFGADTTSMNCQGDTALDVGIMLGRDDCCGVIREHGGKSSREQ